MWPVVDRMSQMAPKIPHSVHPIRCKFEPKLRNVVVKQVLELVASPDDDDDDAIFKILRSLSEVVTHGRQRIQLPHRRSIGNGCLPMSIALESPVAQEAGHHSSAHYQHHAMCSHCEHGLDRGSLEVWMDAFRHLRDDTVKWITSPLKQSMMMTSCACRTCRPYMQRVFHGIGEDTLHWRIVRGAICRPQMRHNSLKMCVVTVGRVR